LSRVPGCVLLSVVDSSPDPKPVTKARTFWQRRVRDPIVNQLTQGVTAEKMALTLAVGSALAMFPILGSTTLLCFIAAILLKLNQPIIQVLNYLCTPIHIPLIYVQFRIGEAVFGAQHVNFSIKYMSWLLWNEPSEFFGRFGAGAFHAVVVWAILAPLWVAVAYFGTMPLLRGIVKVKTENAAKVIAAEAPEHPVP
jgi:uncharacterized protein (DUF2062 family)